MEHFLHALALLARQAARRAKTNPEFNTLADTLFVVCVRLGVPENLLPD